jgi:O-antigen ligase
LVTLPVTSFPFFPPAFGGEALVRPLSLYPLIVLVLLVVLPRLLKKPIPGALLALLPFVLVAIASSLLSLLRGIEPALGISVTARVTRGLSTLLIGCAIYLAIALLPEDKEDLRFTLRWIYIGCAIALFWGSLQAIYILWFDPQWFGWLSKVQQYISYRRLLPERISGLTYEPHWFAEQIIVLLIPGLLAAVMTGYTVFNKRWRWLTFEWLLLIWAVILLPFTFSRSGVLNLVLLLGASLLFFYKPGQKSPSAPGKSSFISRLPIKFSLVICLALIPIYLVGTRNPFFSRIWEYWGQENVSLPSYLSYLGFDARVAYGEAAYNAYLAYPLLGIGLGNYAFYFEEMLPYRPVAALPEILRLITPEKGRDRLVTSKNFYLRLLSETGIIGTIAFFGFVITLSGSALYLWFTPDLEWRYWGMLSLIGLAAFSLSAMTFDSFVIPNMWVVFGIITAATRLYLLTLSQKTSRSPSLSSSNDLE